MYFPLMSLNESNKNDCLTSRGSSHSLFFLQLVNIAKHSNIVMQNLIVFIEDFLSCINNQHINFSLSQYRIGTAVENTDV